MTDSPIFYLSECAKFLTFEELIESFTDSKDMKKKINSLELKDIQDLTSQIDREIVKIYHGSIADTEGKNQALEFLQSFRKIVEKRARDIFKEAMKK
tara:strand:- start:201 stop:491 length:291 start_codon:yes stop_codon:yes gene_type:complete